MGFVEFYYANSSIQIRTITVFRVEHLQYFGWAFTMFRVGHLQYFGLAFTVFGVGHLQYFGLAFTVFRVEHYSVSSFNLQCVGVMS